MRQITLLAVLALLAPVRAAWAQSAGEVTCELLSNGQSSITVPPGQVDFQLAVRLTTNLDLSAVQFVLNGSSLEDFEFAGPVTLGGPFTQLDYSFIPPQPVPADGVSLAELPQFTFFRLEMGNYPASQFTGPLMTFHLRSVAALADGSSYTFTLDHPDLSPLWISVDQGTGETLGDFILMAPAEGFTLNVGSTSGGDDGNSGEDDGQPPDGDDGGDTGSDGTDPDTGDGDTGNTDTGNTDTDTGNTDTDNTDSGNTDTGNTDSGNTDSGNTDTGNTDTGNTDTGDTGDTDSTDSGSGGGGSGDNGGTGSGTGDTGSTGSGDGGADGGNGGSTGGSDTGNSGGSGDGQTGTDTSTGNGTGTDTGGNTGGSGSTGGGSTGGNDGGSGGGTGNTGGNTGGSQDQPDTSGNQNDNTSTGGSTGNNGSTSDNGSAGGDSSNNSSNDTAGEQNPTSTPTENSGPLSTLGGLLLAGLGTRTAVRLLAGGAIGLGSFSVASTAAHWLTRNRVISRPRFLPRPLWGLTGLLAFLWALSGLFSR